MPEKTLDCARKMNNLIQGSYSWNYGLLSELAKNAAVACGADLLLINGAGKVLVYHAVPGSAALLSKVRDSSDRPFLDGDSVRRINSVDNTLENIELSRLLSIKDYVPDGYKIVAAPIKSSGRRTATLLVYKEGSFSEIEIASCLFFASAASLILSALKSGEKSLEIKNKEAVAFAVKTLSYTEMESAAYIFKELSKTAPRDAAGLAEGVLIASKIADKAGITRSVIVNALRKLESAGAIETKSLGVKGTYIKVINEFLINEFNRMYPKI